MITVTVRNPSPDGVAERAVSAPTIERAVEISGPGTPEGCVTRVVFPIDGEAFFGGGRGNAARHAAQAGAAASGPARGATPGSPRLRTRPRATASDAVAAP